MWKPIICLAFLWMHAVLAYAQEKKENVFLHPDKFYQKYLPNLRIKYKPADSNYIKAYPKSYMIVSLHVLAPKIYVDMVPVQASFAASKFRTNTNTITGLSFSYRHITAGFALSLLPPIGDPPDHARSYYRTATIKYKSPIYILTFRFMKIKGVTDVNAFNSPDPLKGSTPRTDVNIKEYEFEGIYNFNWKRYSYLSTIDYTESQIRSHAGFLLKVGIYNQQIYSDTNLLSMQQRTYFEDLTDMTKMISYYVKVSPGVGGKLVVKHFYISLSVFSPVGLYTNRLYASDEQRIKAETSLLWTLDGSVNIGYQSDRFYAAARCDLDSRTTGLHNMDLTSVYNYIGIDIGYRFKAPQFIKKFYRKTMPPGM